MDVHVSLGEGGDLAGQIYRQLRQAVLDGRLRPRDRLPPSREFARRLGVSRTTVSVAYDRLTGEGFLTSRPGSGVFVDEAVGTLATNSAPGGALQARPVWDTIHWSSGFPGDPEIEFRAGLPDASLFPYRAWRRLLTTEMQRSVVGRGIYGDPQGHPRLRAAIARHIAASRAVRATAEDVVVTSGTQQAVDLLARVLLAPGDRAAVEDPGYPTPRSLLRSLGVVVAGVPLDDEGLVVEAIPPGTRLVCVTPSHQFPLGRTMSLARRAALLAWARQHDAAVVEDDYDTEFRFTGRPVDSLQSLDTTGRVIYLGSFSKTTLPLFRLGFLVVPESLRTAIHAAKHVTDRHTSLLPQAALARFIDEGGYARHLRWMRAVYQERRDAILAGLARDFADDLAIVPSTSGLHITALARTASVDDITSVSHHAWEARVAIHTLDVFAAEHPPPAGIMLGYGAAGTDQIADGLARLRRAFDTLHPMTRRR